MNKRETDERAEQMAEHDIPRLAERHIRVAEHEHATRSKRPQHERDVQTLRQQSDDRDGQKAADKSERHRFARSTRRKRRGVAAKFGEEGHEIVGR